MQVKEIVKDWLYKNGYDGLCSDHCGCKLDDLMPCSCSGIEECVAGHLSKCDPETCPADGDCEWHISQ